MGLRDRMQDAGRRAGAAVAKGAMTVGSAAKGLTGNVGAGLDWVQAAIDGLPMRSAPATDPWELSLGALLRRHRRFPRAATRAIGLLDRAGSIRLSASSLGFDELDVDWDKVIEVRTAPVLDHLSASGLEHEVVRIRKLLPPIPGRTWVVRRTAEALVALMSATVNRVRAEGRTRRLIPSAVVYRASFGRTKELVPGVTATVMLGRLPAVGEAILATARARGIPVQVPAGDGAVSPDAAQAQVDALARDLGDLGDESLDSAQPEG